MKGSVTLASFISMLMHLNDSLPVLINQFHNYVYVILFVVIFCETGLVVTPFLPGDSLIFATATVVAMNVGTGTKLDPFIVFPLIFCASVLGDNVNFRIGHFLSDRIRHKQKLRFIKRENLERTHAFYEKHGAATVILAKFMPIIRTFSPFVAGVGAMTYKKFLIFDMIAGFCWVSLFTTLGFAFGKVSFVQEHFTFVELAIIVISVSPAVVMYLKQKFSRKAPSDAA